MPAVGANPRQGVRIALTPRRAGVGINEIDGTIGRYVFVNTRFCEIVGYPREALIGLSPYAITHADDVARDEPFLAQMAAGILKGRSTETRYIRQTAAWCGRNLTGGSRDEDFHERKVAPGRRRGLEEPDTRAAKPCDRHGGIVEEA